MRLLGVVSEIIRVGHHIVRLRQLLPPDLVLPRDGTAAATGLTGQLGPRLLNHLGEQAARYAGNREESELLQLLQRRALVPYLRLLHRWMHEGVLEDPYGEFFITEANEPVSSAAVTAAATASSLAAASSRRRQVAQLFPDLTTLSSEYAAYPSSAGVGTGLGSSGAGGAGTHGQQQQHQQADVLRFERRFSLNKLMIPSFLVKPSRVAKMIFFAGKYCCLLREYNGTLPVFGEVGESMLVWSGVDELHRTIQESFEVVSGAVIQLLFSSSVDLLGHLSSLKSYFLQERGDWVTDFLDSAEALLESSPDKVKAHSVRVLLQGAVARGCATDPYHALIGCSFADASLEQQVLQRAAKSGANAKRNEEDEGQGEDGLVIVDAEAPLPRGSTGTVDSQRCMELLQLDIDLQWPLSLVLDAPVIRRFNSVFRLLTWVKVCERNLCSLWYTNEVLAGFSAAYGIKHQMIQFLRQFQFYAAHFVLEPLWGRLVSRIGQADSIFAISQALDDFFDGVELGMVMSSPHRFRSLAKILDLTVRFGEVGRHSSTATMPLIESTLHSVEDSFLRALSELASPIGPDYSQLVPLLTWIDFSGFYDRNNIYHVQHGAGEAPRRL